MNSEGHRSLCILLPVGLYEGLKVFCQKSDQKLSVCVRSAIEVFLKSKSGQECSRTGK